MSAEWYYSRNGKSVAGPCSAAYLKKLAATGNLTPDDMVGKNRKVRLVKAASVKGLFPSPTA
jgi:hypothetical protein